MGETKIIIISRRKPQALLQKFQLVLKQSSRKVSQGLLRIVEAIGLKKRDRNI